MFFLSPWKHEAVNGQDKTPFAADREVKSDVFDGTRAMGYLKAVCDIGPRMSGTEGMLKQQKLIKKHFEDLGYKVEEQKFAGKQVSRPTPIDMANLIVSFSPEKKRRIIISSHYDTRPLADQEPDRSKWNKPFVSANDGGSGVAFLMELANHMKDLKTEVGVDFVFFDGEEYIFDNRSSENGGDRYFLGSEYFAKSYAKNKQGKDYVGAVLLDMIAGKGAKFPFEVNSLTRANKIVETLWTIAKDNKATAFQFRTGPEVWDDHISLLDVGIPAVDIIDFEYPHWHRLSDVPENCAPDTMIQVARVLTVWMQQTK